MSVIEINDILSHIVRYLNALFINRHRNMWFGVSYWIKHKWLYMIMTRHIVLTTITLQIFKDSHYPKLREMTIILLFRTNAVNIGDTYVFYRCEKEPWEYILVDRNLSWHFTFKFEDELLCELQQLTCITSAASIVSVCRQIYTLCSGRFQHGSYTINHYWVGVTWTLVTV